MGWLSGDFDFHKGNTAAKAQAALLAARSGSIGRNLSLGQVPERATPLDATILLSLFCDDEEGFAWFRCTRDEFGNVTTDRRSVFESMPGTASDEPHVIEARVPINDKVAVRP